MDNAYRRLLETAAQYAVEYVDGLETMPAFPSPESLAGLAAFDEPLPETGADPEAVLALLHRAGSPATAAQAGGRYFGFVCGGLLPAAHAAQWLTDTWNQNSALYLMSPAVSRIEEVCEGWVNDLLGLDPGTAMSLVTGSSNAILCGLAAARNELLARQGHDLPRQGLRDSPPIRVVLGAGAHSAVGTALSVLGIGREECEVVPVDSWGRMDPDQVPELDDRTLLILQAGNVNGGSYDDFSTLCPRAKAAGAWVHIDGAFGLWAAASPNQKHWTTGMELADSWSADAHKTLNTGYDCGILLCRHREALKSAMAAAGAYLPYSEHRDGMAYTTEMSRRARAVSLWAGLKSLGRQGVADLMDHLCAMAGYFAGALESIGMELVIPVFFNQFMVRCETPEQTARVLAAVQAGGVCWCGGSQWEGHPVIRVSVSSHATTREDIDRSVAAFRGALEAVT